MNLQSRRFASSRPPGAVAANVENALNLDLKEWFGIEDERDHVPRARMQAFTGPAGTEFIVMPGHALKKTAWRSSTSPTADTWPMDPGAEMSAEEMVGLRERIDRTPRGRMTLFAGPAGTMVIVTDGQGRQSAAVRASPSRRVPTRRSKGSTSKSSAMGPFRPQEGDTAVLLSTAEAAEYCKFSNDSALRVAKLRGLITPDQTGPRRSHLWRRATLDAYLARSHPPTAAPAQTSIAVPLVADAAGPYEVRAETLDTPPLAPSGFRRDRPHRRGCIGGHGPCACP